MDGESATYCAKSFGPANDPGGLIRPGGPDWGEAAPRAESLRLVPAGTPGIEIDGHGYRLWYDQIPEHAIRRRVRVAARPGDG